MSDLRYDLATIGVLWRRDVMRFLRQPSRLAGALGQPVIFWLVIGSGLSPTFQLPGLAMNYLEFFFPGVIVMVLVFASIFSSISVIDDRTQGFLQAVITGPGSRAAMVLGKCFGSTTVALIQASLFLLLAPLAGFDVTQTAWLLLLGAMTLASLGLTAMGFLVAWLLDNVQAYHAIQMVVLVPLWVVSGAMFPPNPGSGAFMTLMTFNPVSYAVTATRHAFYGMQAPAATVLEVSAAGSMLVLAAFATFCLGCAMIACERKI